MGVVHELRAASGLAATVLVAKRATVRDKGLGAALDLRGRVAGSGRRRRWFGAACRRQPANTSSDESGKASRKAKADPSFHAFHQSGRDVPVSISLRAASPNTDPISQMK